MALNIDLNKSGNSSAFNHWITISFVDLSLVKYKANSAKGAACQLSYWVVVIAEIF